MSTPEFGEQATQELRMPRASRAAGDLGEWGVTIGQASREGQLQQLTEDHSWVNAAVRSGALAPEEARDHPRRNLVTRVLGDLPDVEVDLARGRLQPGDVLILCTDGLHG